MASSKKKKNADKKSETTLSKQAAGFLQDMPGDVRNYIKKQYLKNPAGAITGQQTMNEYNASLNAALNRPQEYTPYGQQTYSVDPQTGQVTKRFDLSAGQQGIDTAQTGYDTQAIQGAQKSLGQFQQQGPFSYAGIPQAFGAQDLLGQRNQVQDQLNQAWEQRNAPIFQQQQNQLEQRLRDQGLSPGSKAYEQQLQQFRQSQNDARTQAQAVNTQQGLAETQGLSGISLANRQQATGEYGQQYYAPLDSAAGQFQGVRGVVQPNFTPMANVDVGNVDLPGTYLNYKQMDINQQIANKPGPSLGGGGGGVDYASGAVNAMLGGVQAGAPTTAGATGGSGYGNIFANIGQGFGQGILAGAYAKPTTTGRGFLS